jgi:hypothetical protein
MKFPLQILIMIMEYVPCVLVKTSLDQNRFVWQEFFIFWKTKEIFEIESERYVISTCQKNNSQHKIEEKAKLLNDTSLLCKISAIGDFIAKEYHRSCQEYADRAKSIIKENNEKEKSSW